MRLNHLQNNKSVTKSVNTLRLLLLIILHIALSDFRRTMIL